MIKLYEFIIRNLFKFPIIIGITSYIRFIYFTKIIKNFKTLYPLDSETISKRETKDFKDLKKLSFSKGDQVAALNTNLHHTINPLKNMFYNISQRFNGQRSTMLISPLKSIDFINIKNSKILSVGPRIESEIFNLVGHGFRPNNIEAIDLQSYSKLIKLGDMLDIPFEKNHFDIVICGWVLSYTNKIKEAINELVRVTKDRGFICIGISDKDSKLTSASLSSSKELISYFGDYLKEVYFKYHPGDIDIKTKQQLKSFRSVIVVEIKK